MNRNRNRIGFGAAASLVAAGLLGWSGSARAADESNPLGTSPRLRSTPQNFAFEIRGAAYSALVDTDPTLAASKPYATALGDTPRLELGVELDWQALRIPYLGTLGPGFSVGYTTASAKAKRVDNGQDSGEDTSLDIYPFYGVAVLRVDVFAREAHIPLVPYVKGGVGMALWRASNTLGTSASKTNGAIGRGHTFGTHVAIGAALQLDVFDMHAAQQLDETTGINHTYLFGEYMMSDLNGIAQTDVLYVGTHSFAAGLAFEF